MAGHPPTDRPDDGVISSLLREQGSLDAESDSSSSASPSVPATFDASSVARAGAGEGRSRGAKILGVVAGALVAPALGAVSMAVGASSGVYGFTMFVLTPLATGFVAAVVAGARVRQSCGACAGVGMLAVLLPLVVLLAVGIEGMICIAMAVPLVVPLAALGGAIGYCFQSGRAAESLRGFRIVGPMVALAAAHGVEPALRPVPPLRCVETSIDVSADAQRTWDCVVEFPDLPRTQRWFFRAGVAHPLRARIVGSGVGSVRYCEFSTGDFVEPIEVYDPPRRLAFAVTDCPPPLRELSPHDIHPPHLDGYLVSRRGEFELTPTGEGTRVTGRTWYTNDLWPQWYWGLWSDAIVGAIHGEVLEHIRVTAQKAK